MPDEDNDAVMEFVTDNLNDNINSNDTNKSYYSQLKPKFIEAINCMTNQE